MTNVLFEMSNKRFGVAFCGGMVCLALILIVDRILINIEKQVRDMENNKCSNCENLQQSIYMKLEDETLYNIWCKAGNIEDKNCDKFIETKKRK